MQAQPSVARCSLRSYSSGLDTYPVWKGAGGWGGGEGREGGRLNAYQPKGDKLPVFFLWKPSLICFNSTEAYEELEVDVECSEECYTAASGVGGRKCGCSRWAGV